MLIGGKWGDGWACPVCGCSNSGALLKCHSCEYKRPADDEIYPLYNEPSCDREAIEFARAVIAADREKNNANNNS